MYSRKTTQCRQLVHKGNKKKSTNTNWHIELKEIYGKRCFEIHKPNQLNSHFTIRTQIANVLDGFFHSFKLNVFIFLWFDLCVFFRCCYIWHFWLILKIKHKNDTISILRISQPQLTFRWKDWTHTSQNTYMHRLAEIIKTISIFSHCRIRVFVPEIKEKWTFTTIETWSSTELSWSDVQFFVALKHLNLLPEGEKSSNYSNWTHTPINWTWTKTNQFSIIFFFWLFVWFVKGEVTENATFWKAKIWRHTN